MFSSLDEHHPVGLTPSSLLIREIRRSDSMGTGSLLDIWFSLWYPSKMALQIQSGLRESETGIWRSDWEIMCTYLAYINHLHITSNKKIKPIENASQTLTLIICIPFISYTPTPPNYIFLVDCYCLCTGNLQVEMWGACLSSSGRWWYLHVIPTGCTHTGGW